MHISRISLGLRVAALTVTLCLSQSHADTETEEAKARSLWESVERFIKAEADKIEEASREVLEQVLELEDRLSASEKLQASARIRASVLGMLVADPRANSRDQESHLSPRSALRVLWLVQTLGGWHPIVDGQNSGRSIWQPSSAWYARLMVEALALGEKKQGPKHFTVSVLAPKLEFDVGTVLPSSRPVSHQLTRSAEKRTSGLDALDLFAEEQYQASIEEVWKFRLLNGNTALELGIKIVQLATELGKVPSSVGVDGSIRIKFVEALEDLAELSMRYLPEGDNHRFDILSAVVFSLSSLEASPKVQSALESVISKLLNEFKVRREKNWPLAWYRVQELDKIRRNPRPLIVVANGSELLVAIARVMFQETKRMDVILTLAADLKSRVQKNRTISEAEKQELKELLHPCTDFPWDRAVRADRARALLAFREIAAIVPDAIPADVDLNALILHLTEDLSLPLSLRNAAEDLPTGACDLRFRMPNR